MVGMLEMLTLVTILTTLVSGLDITIDHSPDVDIRLYINGETVNGSGVSEYRESKWMEFDNETVWSFHDRTYNKTTTNTTHKFNGTAPKST